MPSHFYTMCFLPPGVGVQLGKLQEAEPRRAQNLGDNFPGLKRGLPEIFSFSHMISIDFPFAGDVQLPHLRGCPESKQMTKPGLRPMARILIDLTEVHPVVTHKTGENNDIVLTCVEETTLYI